MTIKFVFLFSRQGKLRLAKWFNSYPEKVPKNPSSPRTLKLNKVLLVFLQIKVLLHIDNFCPCRTRRNWHEMWFLLFWLEDPRCALSLSIGTTSRLFTSAMPGAFWKWTKSNLSLVLVFSSVVPLHLVLSKDWQLVLNETCGLSVFLSLALSKDEN